MRGTLEYALGIFGCNFTFDDERQQRIANARNFLLDHQHLSHNECQNNEEWFLVGVQCRSKSTHSQWLADDGLKARNSCPGLRIYTVSEITV